MMPSESSPSGEPVAEVACGDPPPTPPTPEPEVPPAPAQAADSHEASTSSDDDGSGTVREGEVVDLGERGRYTVKECLGRGGMGAVYRAEYVAADGKEVVQVVALKVVRPDAHPRHARDFSDEVRLLSLLRHNHIARYHDFFVHKGRQVLVMEHVEGRSLHAILALARRKGQKLSEATSLELLAQVADALGYAHAAKDEDGCPLNIVHRDVSPSNIMVSSAGNAVLIDFGVARADLEERTQTASDILRIRGKPAYLAPEQMLMQPVDGRADLYALGTILVEMQTGEPPFGRTADVATLLFTALVTRGRVNNLTRGLSDKVRAICRKALAFAPYRRFADGGEMAAAMLADLPRRGPEAVKEEIAALEALPDAPARTSPAAPPVPERRALPDAPAKRVERDETELRRVSWKHRAVMAIGALAVGIVPCFFFWSAYSSRSTVPPHEQPMPPNTQAAEGKPTVSDSKKPVAGAPEISEAAAAAPGGEVAVTESRTLGALFTAFLCAATPGCVHIQTGAKAGDCNYRVERELDGIPIPDVVHVRLDPSNPNGNCTGEFDEDCDCRDEPCPVYDNMAIIMHGTGGSHEENMLFGPRYDWPGKIDIHKRPLLIGTTKTFEATGMYDSGGDHRPRELSGRMTALVTKIRSWDGKKEVPVCGVLIGYDDKEGVPIFRSPVDGKPFGGEWGDAYIKFFWPDNRK